MPSYTDFARWLFPGDSISSPNPASIPGAAREVLELVACSTQVPIGWLSKSCRLVLDGLAGAQCLWYLHGAEGVIEHAIEERDWPGWMHDFVLVARQEAFDRLSSKDPHVKWVGAGADYGPGTIEFGIQYDDGRPSKVRTEKIGKLLRKMGYKPEVIKEFETRELGAWEWRISAHPFDVLTMSFNRPWTSCMSPGGAAELGPLTDMAAGSACMFFYRPGAHKPCGRLILRPVLLEDEHGLHPSIASGGSIYGSGPRKIKVADLQQMLSEQTGEGLRVAEVPLCIAGRSGKALSRFIYSDTDRTYCKQTDAQYDAAYRHLLGAQWPESRLAIGDLPLKAKEAIALVGEFESTTADDMVQLARDVADEWFDEGVDTVADILQTIQAIDSHDIPYDGDYDALDTLLGRDATHEERRDFARMTRDRAEERMEGALSELSTTVLKISQPDDPDIERRIGRELSSRIIDYEEPLEDDAPWAIIYIPEGHGFEDSELDTSDLMGLIQDSGILINKTILGPGKYDWSDLVHRLLYGNG